MNKKDAYKIVFDDLKQCELFNGHYNAKNGNEQFMYGISTVMEFIAYRVDHSTGVNFEDDFLKNMSDSREKAEKL